MLDRERGDGTAMAMRIPVRTADVHGTGESQGVTQARIDGVALPTDAGLEPAETRRDSPPVVVFPEGGFDAIRDGDRLSVLRGEPVTTRPAQGDTAHARTER